MNIIAVVGPSKIDNCADMLGTPANRLIEVAFETGKTLGKSGCEMVAVPYQGIGYHAAKGYKEAHGKCLCGILPVGISSEIQCTEIIEAENWIRQPEYLVSRANVMVVIGLSAGTLIEICLTKRYRNYLVLIFRDFVTHIPIEIQNEINMKYISNIEDMENIITDINK